MADEVASSDPAHQHVSGLVDHDDLAHHAVQAAVDAFPGHRVDRIVADEVVFPWP